MTRLCSWAWSFALLACSRAVAPAPSAAAAGAVSSPPSAAAAGAVSSPPSAAAAGAVSSPPSAAAPAGCATGIDACPAQVFGTWEQLLQAEEFGSAARFVALDGQAVLVAQTDTAFTALRLRDPDGAAATPKFSAWTFPTRDLEGIAIADDRLFRSGGVFALACDRGRTRCEILQGQAGQTELAVWQSVPDALAARGIVIDDTTSRPVLCVFGDGMACFEQAWQTLIAPAGMQLNAVTLGNAWSLAVGEHGRWFKRERSSDTWQEQPELGDVALTQCSVLDAGGVITGAGRLQAVLGTQAESLPCGAPAGLVALLLQYGSPGMAWALTSAHDVLVHAPGELHRRDAYCSFDRLPAEDVLATSSAPCGIAMNPRALTARALVGLNFCAIE